MNKKLIALAVAAAAIAPTAFAAGNEVVLYGQVNVGVEISARPGAEPDQTKISNLSSRIGFKGQEDLGDGLSAFFKIESAVAPDDASRSGFGTREAWVGLKGDWGSVAAGRGKSPYTQATEEFDPFYLDDSLGLTNHGSNDNYRINNAIRFDGAYGPVTYSYANSFGENKGAPAGTRSTNDFSMQAKYAAENFSLVGAYGVFKPKAGKAVKRLLLGGTFTMGDLSLSLAGQHRNDGNDKFTDPLLLVGYSMGDLSLQAGAIFWDKDTMANTKTQGTAGLFYNLSKRTVVTGEYTNSYAGVKGHNTFTLGLNHSF
ncbi:porin [Chitinimonas arctica]|uniref:Porin n=1 Tax=Chitinimonas arctica TaxID=2594795 RepID=A0A516SI23_9NEIS|nr:porin [Chitinimonas arctica]QDQ27807.1 porin [Chitinimonas arctica]